MKNQDRVEMKTNGKGEWVPTGEMIPKERSRRLLVSNDRRKKMAKASRKRNRR